MPRALKTLSAMALLAALGHTPAFAQSATPKVLKKVPLEFPAEAVRKGVDRGVRALPRGLGRRGALKARLTIDGSGAVTDASIIETTPSKAKMLNEPVLEVLNKWRFEGNGKPTTFDMQVVLTAD